MSAHGSRSNARRGVSLPETHLLIVLLAVVGVPLAALIWGTRAQDDAYAAYHNLLKLRQLIEQYRRDHLDGVPTDLSALTESTTASGKRSGTSVTTDEYPIAAYLATLPENPLCEGTAAEAQQVRQIPQPRPLKSDITPGGRGAWLYHPQTGSVWIDHVQFHHL